MSVLSDGNTWLTRGCVRECADELQRRSGPDDTAADNVARSASHRDVRAHVPQQSSPAPRHLQRERQSDNTSVVGSAQAGPLHQAQTYSDGMSSVYFAVVNVADYIL